MKKIILWTIATGALMIGVPWLAVTFAGSAGMAVCFVLFFAVNPIYSAISGVFAGRNIQRLWPIPFLAAGLFLSGAWLFFEMGETAFLQYAGCYFMIAVTTMLISAFANKRKR